MAVEDRKLRIVVKDHYCNVVGELASFERFDCVSRVNDVGEAVLVAGYGHSDENDAILDELATGDTILEAYIKPPGASEFLDAPAWAGFLRDRRVSQDGPSPVVTAVFKDFNHLLQRRVVKPPDGGSHDEAYGTASNVMRDLVRKHAGGEAEEARRFCGLAVEADEEEGLYGAAVSELVLGSNVPDWVRCDALHAWNGWLYAGLETQPASGAYAEVWRSANGTDWEQAFDGAPGAYAHGVTGVHCFCEFGGQLWAGCSQEWQSENALVMRSPDGVTWTRMHEFENDAGVWALAGFDGLLYAGTTGGTAFGSETYVWRSADGLAWTSQAEATATVGEGCPCITCGPPAGDFGVEHNVACEALHEFDGRLYAGVAWKYVHCAVPGTLNCLSTYQARVYRTDDGAAWNQVLSSASRHGFLSFLEWEGHLYASSGWSRWLDFFCSQTIDYGWGGAVYRSADGAAWDQVFGGDLSTAQACAGVTSLLSTTDPFGEPALWAAAGKTTGGKAKIWQSLDGEAWAVVANLTTINYAFILSLAELLNERYAATGCFAKVGSWQADHGDVWRIEPSTTDVADAGTVGRWVTLLEKLREIAESTGCDFGIVGKESLLYCDECQEFEFQVRCPQWGADNRWDEDAGTGVSFALGHGNMAVPVLDELRQSRPTFLYLLGPSSGGERTVEGYQNAAWIDESPWSRVEGAVDAQSVDSGQARESVGNAEIELQGPRREITCQVLELDDCHHEPEGYAS